MTAVAVAPTPAEDRVRVRVLFGEHTIIDWTGTPEAAQRFAAAQARRFASCRVESTPVPVPR